MGDVSAEKEAAGSIASMTLPSDVSDTIDVLLGPAESCTNSASVLAQGLSLMK